MPWATERNRRHTANAFPLGAIVTSTLKEKTKYGVFNYILLLIGALIIFAGIYQMAKGNVRYGLDIKYNLPRVYGGLDKIIIGVIVICGGICGRFGNFKDKR